MTKVSNYWNVLKPSAGSICLFPLGCASLRMRVQKMPVREDAVLNDLQTAIMYWHGRDKSCRPILVWRMEKVYALGAFPASFGLKSGVASQVWFRVHIDIAWYIYIHITIWRFPMGVPPNHPFFLKLFQWIQPSSGDPTWRTPQSQGPSWLPVEIPRFGCRPSHQALEWDGINFSDDLTVLKGSTKDQTIG